MVCDIYISVIVGGDMRPYVIVSPDFTTVCGGIKVLHRLCHILNSKGYDAYITGRRASPQYSGYCNTKHVSELSTEERIWLQHNGIVVYPEIVGGNPLCFDTVVHWELSVAHANSDHWLVFTYLENKCDKNVKIENNLFIWHVEECFKLPDVDARGKTCYVVHKGAHLPRIPETNPPCIDVWNKSPDNIAKIFQESKIFYSYDDMTALTIEARLCGCPVKIIGYTGTTYESLRACPFSCYGQAAPEEDIDIDKLKSEIPLFRDNYLKVIERVDVEVDKFIDITQNTHNEYFACPEFNQAPQAWLPRSLFPNRS